MTTENPTGINDSAAAAVAHAIYTWHKQMGTEVNTNYDDSELIQYYSTVWPDEGVIIQDALEYYDKLGEICQKK